MPSLSLKMCFLVVCLTSYIGLGQTTTKKLCGRALPRAVFLVCGMAKRGGPRCLHQSPSLPVLGADSALPFAVFRRSSTRDLPEYSHGRWRRSTLRRTADRCCRYGCSFGDLARVC